MSDNPYSRMAKEGPLSDALDSAIAEENARAISGYSAKDKARDIENAARWTALTKAQGVAQGYGVVLPIALAEDLLKIMRGEPTSFSAEALERSFEAALTSAQIDKEQQR